MSPAAGIPAKSLPGFSGGAKGHALLRPVLTAIVLLAASAGQAGAAAPPEPGVTLTLAPTGGANLSMTVQILLLLTALSLAPAFVILMTSFTRIVVVLGFLRQALGTQQSPPTQVLVGLALFLTIFIMGPVWEKVNETALQPYLKKEMSQEQALTTAAGPLKEFMLRQTREKDLLLFVEMANIPAPSTAGDLPIRIVIPAFIVSELKTAFQIGFMIYIPFLILDMVVASVLLSMGMMMLPPIVISLPFKLMLFVLVDGWALLVGTLVRSFA
ncbi:MAG: flagellar type III secretion system pore protein FliP [Nitrospirae bacterium]|nr:flagellar type III secretion system pore protein FliP [Nitrospirota bacterium]